MKGRTLLLLLIGGTTLTLSVPVALRLLVLRNAPMEPLPPLLQDLGRVDEPPSGRLAWSAEGCPPPPSLNRDLCPEGISLALTARLGVAFPPGTDADALQAEITAQGFRLKGPCRNEPTIYRASYVQKALGFGLAMPLVADIAWKRRVDGRVEWTKGFFRLEFL